MTYGVGGTDMRLEERICEGCENRFHIHSNDVRKLCLSCNVAAGPLIKAIRKAVDK